MLVSDLLNPQKPSKKKTSKGTVAEVFIIESLSLIDEGKERHEGEVLANVLKMCGKKPLYYYIRTKAELAMLAEEFEASGYRYLHLSCHGCGFNRWMQRIGEIVPRVFRSLVFSLGAHSISALRH